MKVLRNLFLVYAGLCTLGLWASLGALLFGDTEVVSPIVLLGAGLLYGTAALVALYAAGNADKKIR